MSDITQNGSLARDDNDAPVMGGTSSADDGAIVNSAFNPITRALLIEHASSAVTLVVGTTTITNGTTTRILYDNAGVLGEYTISGTGTVVAMATSPAFTTPSLGVATATSINGLTITATTGTLTLANGSTLATSGANSITFTSTGPTGVTLPTSGTLMTNPMTTGGDVIYGGASGVPTRLANGSAGQVLTSGGTTVAPTWETPSATALTIGTTTITSGTTTRILYNNAGVLGEYTLTGTGTVVAMQTAPSFLTSITTPSVLASSNDSGALGASGTAFSDLFLASGGIINWNAGNATITHSTGLLTSNVPVASPQIYNADNAIAASSNAATVTRAFRNNVVTNDSAATLTITMSTTSATGGDQLLVQILDASAVAQTITWVNTEDSTVTAPTTSNGSTTLPLTVGFKWNAATSKWRCIAKA